MELGWESETSQITDLVVSLLAQMPTSRMIELKMTDEEVNIPEHSFWRFRSQQAGNAAQILGRYLWLSLQWYGNRLCRGWGVFCLCIWFLVACLFYLHCKCGEIIGLVATG